MSERLTFLLLDEMRSSFEVGLLEVMSKLRFTIGWQQTKSSQFAEWGRNSDGEARLKISQNRALKEQTFQNKPQTFNGCLSDHIVGIMYHIGMRLSHTVPLRPWVILKIVLPQNSQLQQKFSIKVSDEKANKKLTQTHRLLSNIHTLFK